MKQINDFTLTKLSNDEDFGFHLRIVEQANAGLTEETGGSLLKAYLTAYEAFDEAMKQSSKNSKTADVAAADLAADNAWRFGRAYIRAMVHHPVAATAAAAARISECFDKYGDFTKLGYTKEYGLYHNLLQDLSAVEAEDLTATAFSDWVASMNSAYSKFMVLNSAKVNEEAGRQSGIVKECRAATDTAYRNLVQYVNVMVLANGEDAYATFIDQVNVIVAEMAANIATYAARAAGEQTETETEETTPAE